MIKLHVILMLLISSGITIIGCSNSISLGDDFEVSSVDIPDNRNLYYKRQGIFSSLGVNQIIYNEDKILLRGYLYSNGDTRLDKSRYVYYLIDKKAYMINPGQQNSTGLIGPILFEEYEAIAKRLKNAKTKSW
ncbi:hypothetical protein ACFE6N_07505 [Pedobacter sp. BG31]|uniref:hypothetical protein n=1 Tax=Pedobacter sp. BG31 TaxID=3349697 RepID=UPI0035F4BD92